MTIYDIEYDNRIHGEKEEIGMTVKVVKGRKYPLGNEYVAKFFYRDGWGNRFALMESGEKINLDNLELAKPRIISKAHIFYGDGMCCPNCKADRKNLVFQYEHFDPLWDIIYNRHMCAVCDADIDERK